MAEAIGVPNVPRRQPGMEKLTERQVDYIYCLRLAFFLKVGDYNNEGVHTQQEYEDLSNSYNGIIEMVFDNEIQ